MSTPHLEEFIASYPFPLDPFQLKGCQSIEEGRGVLVCAPTGAGKTVVGEFAVSLALARGTRCFYTTPIKALSNQKYHDLVERHGSEAVGLMTGDQVINGDAQVIVMTTEVLRNMIYADSSALHLLSHVVMDEVHYLGDRSRGGVWEEVILNLDESVTIVGLSATVSNSEEFGEWLSTVRGDTDVIVTDFRPVPLNQWLAVGKKILPMFDQRQEDTRLNPAVLRAIDRFEEDRAEDDSRGGFRGRSTASRSEADSYRSTRWQRRRGSTPTRRILGRPEMLASLRAQDMLPAIVFIFSRAGCEGALYQSLRSQLVLTNQEEAQQIEAIIDAGVADIPAEDLKVLNFRQWRAALSRGFAAHHAGMLPAFRHIVEELFVKGLIKAVFATETLALGINMPARTVVLEKIVKFNGESHADLTPGEYTQLTGRAGRRGIDTVGNAVVQWSPAIDPEHVAGLASTRTYPLLSTFAPGYNMSINLLKSHGYEGSISLLESSFAQFQSNASVVGEARRLERARSSVRDLDRQLEKHISDLELPSENPVEDLLEYLQLRRDLSLEEKRMHKANREERQREIHRSLASMQLGDIIAMPTKKRPLLAVVVQVANNRDDPRPLVVAESGWSGRIEMRNFARPPITLTRVRLPREVINRPQRAIRAAVQTVQRAKVKRPQKLSLKPRVRPSQKQQELADAVRRHPVHAWPAVEREQLARVGEKLLRRRADATAIEKAISHTTETLGHTFTRILHLLEEMDYVQRQEGQWMVTEEGERLAEIHNECDLLVAQCLKRGVWEGLDPAELAGVVSTCAFENRKETSAQADAPTDAMAVAMSATWRIWQELHADEQRYGLPSTRAPEDAFALAIHQWTASAPLGYSLEAAAASGAELSPGDFVRWCRRVVDLLEQVAVTGYSSEIKANARQAVNAIQRGVVAIGN